MPVNGHRIEIAYPVHYLADGRTICGHALAGELIADALRLLIAMNGGNHTAACDAFDSMAEAAADRLDAEARAGNNVGLVLRRCMTS
ncbi:MAG: hypothetical protein M5U16_01210 [Hyphomicrobium sp.]|nr:hypothetical protein [Hyphomicrobium sp.]